MCIRDRIKTHPCIKQFGVCKYGSQCLHTNQPEDICVHFLNNRCRQGKGECPWRHERNADIEVIEARKGAHAVKQDEMWSERAPVTQESVMQMYTRNNAAAQATSASSAPSFDQPSYQPSESEEKVFLSLVEAFPNRDVAEVMQVLRHHKGDPSEAATALMVVPDFDGVFDDMLDEEDSTDTRTEELLTLCTLFPSIDITEIEMTFVKGKHKFEATYTLLQRRVVGLQRNDVQPRSAMLAADKLKLDKLKSLFPTIRTDVIEEVFGQVDGGMPTIIKALSMLGKEDPDVTAEDLVEADKLRSSHNIARSAARQRLGVKSNDADSFIVSTATEEPEPQSFISDTSLYQQVIAQADGLDDWRRLRKEALMMNKARLACMRDAAIAFAHDKGDVAHKLSRKGKQLGIAYDRLNILAMHARERELDDNIQSLDLHGFHVQEAMDVLYRRLQLCAQKDVPTLRVVTGRGLHSKSGSSILFKEICEAIGQREPFVSMAEVRSCLLYTSPSPRDS
eukprot:TRINITY_DN24692_c0_g1_i1.p1 TRINITY_DN24692_c0_g1~~TRINITY_DN24692_c0_g1_i1.p1  ORF type:complete len:508 (-),score=76.60 TRINITY_DN24692_c0_g1_i1:111-1634(-)